MIKLSITLNKNQLELIVDEMKPLSQILYEDLGISNQVRTCNGKLCGNCLVLVNTEPTLSCLIPAFKLQDACITTFDAFKQTAHYRNIRRIYDTLNSEPCPNCYESKTLIFESILLKAKTKRQESENNLDDFSRKFASKTKKLATSNKIDEESVNKEFSLNSCSCMNSKELLEIAVKAFEDRTKRRVL